MRRTVQRHLEDTLAEAILSASQEGGGGCDPEGQQAEHTSRPSSPVTSSASSRPSSTSSLTPPEADELLSKRAHHREAFLQQAAIEEEATATAPPPPPPPPAEEPPKKTWKFTASDGAGFDDRRAYRKYEFELSYTFKKQRGSPDAPLELRKEPGAIEGQPFEMAELADCTVVLLDHSEAIQVDYLVNCRVFIGACCDSVFVRNCTGCTFTMACKQLRTRECVDCTFYLYTMTEPVIEMSSDVRFAPFNGAYPEHPDHMAEARLDPALNLWFAVFDFNDDAKTGDNWRLLSRDEEEAVWCPAVGDAGGAIISESTIPRVEAGSIPIPRIVCLESMSLCAITALSPVIMSTHSKPTLTPSSRIGSVLMPPMIGRS